MDSPLQTNLCKGSSKFQEYEGTVHYYHIITFRQIQYVSSSGNPLPNRSCEKCAAINTSSTEKFVLDLESCFLLQRYNYLDWY